MSAIKTFISVVSSGEFALDLAYVIADSVFTQVFAVSLPLLAALGAIILQYLLGLQEWMADSAPLTLVRILALR